MCFAQRDPAKRDLPTDGNRRGRGARRPEEEGPAAAAALSLCLSLHHPAAGTAAVRAPSPGGKAGAGARLAGRRGPATTSDPGIPFPGRCAPSSRGRRGVPGSLPPSGAAALPDPAPPAGEPAGLPARLRFPSGRRRPPAGASPRPHVTALVPPPRPIHAQDAAGPVPRGGARRG